MRNLNCTVLSSSDSASHSGIQIDANQLISASFQAIFSDTSAAGTIQVQMSNDVCNDGYQANTFTVTNWSNIPSASATVTAGVAEPITIAQMCYRWIRVIFTESSPGTGNVTVNMNALSL